MFIFRKKFLDSYNSRLLCWVWREPASSLPDAHQERYGHHPSRQTKYSFSLSSVQLQRRAHRHHSAIVRPWCWWTRRLTSGQQTPLPSWWCPSAQWTRQSSTGDTNSNRILLLLNHWSAGSRANLSGFTAYQATPGLTNTNYGHYVGGSSGGKYFVRRLFCSHSGTKYIHPQWWHGSFYQHSAHLKW